MQIPSQQECAAEQGLFRTWVRIPRGSSDTGLHREKSGIPPDLAPHREKGGTPSDSAPHRKKGGFPMAGLRQAPCTVQATELLMSDVEAGTLQGVKQTLYRELKYIKV